MRTIKTIHSAYGVTLKGEYGTYTWFDGRVTDVIYAIYINDRKVELGNRDFIIAEDKTNQYINMESDKDLLCYFFAHHDLDDWELENFFAKEYKSSWWKHRTQDMQIRERLDNQRKAEQERREQNKAKQIAEVLEYANKKNLHVVMLYDDMYLLKVSQNNLDAVKCLPSDMVIEFAKEHPGNGCDIVEVRRLTA